MIGATEVRKGMVVRYEDHLWFVMNVYHHTPGNLRAVIQIKMRNLTSGAAIEQRFSSSDKLEQAFIDTSEMEYLYQDGETYVFMNQESCEQISIHKELLGEDAQWLKENILCKVEVYEGRVIGVELPAAVELKVVETEPGLKGATITNVYKAAKLETGAVVQVPPFIENGAVIRVDTREGKYLDRVSVK
ncbi:MAG: elongation factor P [Planctomycetes bacterium]|nr:elongation factor P [Planctomycetota bacterium]